MATEAEIIDKAKELVEKFYKACSMTIAGAGTIQRGLAKKAALICVEEILSSSDHPGGWDTYWQQVREAIEKLK